jgi:RNA polymerase sigma-70 factor (ECF subfamily)
MADLPITQPSLLVRLQDPRDQDAWRQFVRIYAPVVYGYARQRGLQDADAADLTQEVLQAVTTAAGRLDYDPRRGSFRGWLFTVAHHKLYDFLARRRRECRGSGDSNGQLLLEQLPAREEDAAAWDEEYARRLFAWAADQVRGSFHETTWNAFWRTAVEGQSGKEVAEALGMTVAAVYLAKSRVMARLKKCLREFQGE